MRLLRLALIPWLGPLVVAIGCAVNLTVGPQPWRGDALLITYWAWTALFLAGPVVATVAAVDGARLFHGSTVWSLPAYRRWITLRLWGTGTAVSVAPVVLALIWMLGSVAYVKPDVLPAVLWGNAAGLLTVALLIGLGLALGSLWGKVYGPLAAFGAALVLQLASYLGDASVLMVGGASDSLLGLTTAPLAVAVQIIGLILLILCIAVILLRPRGTRTVRGWWAVPALGALILGAVLWPSQGAPRFEAVEEPADGQRCLELGPQTRPAGTGTVCYSGEHQHLGGKIATAWAELTQAAATAGVTQLPDTLEETTPVTGPDWIAGRAPGTVGVYGLSAAQLDPASEDISASWLAGEVATPHWCPGLWAEEPPSDAYFEKVESAQEALRAVVEAPSSPAGKSAAVRFDAAWQELKACPGA